MKLDSQTVLSLATTVYFKARWYDEFSKEATSPQTFHAPGGDVETDFMHSWGDQSYFWGEKFSAVAERFVQGGAMWFLLPNEGVSPEELLTDGEAMDFLFSTDNRENNVLLRVNKSIPKFDVVSQLDLNEGLNALGVTDVFDPEKSDFTPMTTDVDDPVVLSEVSHAARVVIDEEGCTAAAFTLMQLFALGVTEDVDEVDFVLDRPFLFCITNDSGLPLFMGIVNNPAAE